MKKLNHWSCMAASFAYVAGIDEEHFYEIIGHDGGEIVFPTMQEPQRRRGHHIQECISAMLGLGFTVTPIEYYPMILSPTPRTRENIIVSFGDNRKRFEELIKSSTGVIECRTGQSQHAVANDLGFITDPDGMGYGFDIERMAKRNLYPFRYWKVDCVTRNPRTEQCNPKEERYAPQTDDGWR